MTAQAKTRTQRRMILTGAFIFNPVLIQLAGICPVAAASTDVVSSVFFAIVFTLTTFVSCFVASAILKKVPRWLRVAIYLILGLAVICPILYAVERTGYNISAKTQLYLPLLAVNSVTAVHCEQFSVKHTVQQSMQDAVAVSIGFGTVMILTGTLRELLGSGSFAGFELKLPVTLSGMLLPFGSFIILGYLAALLKWYINKYRPEFNEQTSAKISQAQVSLRKGKIIADDTQTAEIPVDTASESVETDEAVQDEDFEEIEEIEIFSEFWQPPTIEELPAEASLEALSNEHKKYSTDAERRFEELFDAIDIALPTDDESGSNTNDDNDDNTDTTVSDDDDSEE